MGSTAGFQMELYGPVPMVSRWPGDGPHASEVWRDEGDGRQIRRFFDGAGWCQMMCAPCRTCDVYHPLDHDWQDGGHRAESYRCPTGRADWPALPIKGEVQ